MATKYSFDICAVNNHGADKVLLSCTFEAEDAEQAEKFKKATLQAWAKIYPSIDTETATKMLTISGQ